MFTFLLIIQAIVASALIGVILMQRSEGGGLGVGSSSAGLMTARGAADFLTRATAILATLFILLSIGLAALAAAQTASRDIDTSLARSPAAPATNAPLPTDVPLAGGASGAADPLAGAAATAASNRAAPKQKGDQGVPLAE